MSLKRGTFMRLASATNWQTGYGSRESRVAVVRPSLAVGFWGVTGGCLFSEIKVLPLCQMPGNPMNSLRRQLEASALQQSRISPERVLKSSTE